MENGALSTTTVLDFSTGYDACVAPGGAALFLDEVGIASLHRCHFNSTVASESTGGVIFLSESDLTLTACMARDSRADYYGNAISQANSKWP